ncbi:hypothetical protein ACFSR6_00105 [Pedobacter vanadiisoli]|uniref:Uncharacterized protein n=1 Tax=Pedobacter vanadiisoli TaxID=1761975 RepID=A0ABW5MDH1_9SPHI
MKEELTTQLKGIREKLNSDDIRQIHNQINLLERFISRYFENSSYYHQLLGAKKSVGMIEHLGDGVMGYQISNVKETCYGILDNMILETENFGVPTKNDMKVDKSININNHNNNTQTQTLNLEILKEAFKESLTGKQYKELAEIVEEEKDITKATPRLIDKIKSFGGDVASNVLASLITNPTIYNGLF